MSNDPPRPALGDSDELGHHWGLTQSERLWGLLALLVALALMAALIALFWQPAPPRRVIMSTGTEDGAYHAYGLRYREILARAGVELVLRPSAGAVENLQRLREGRDGVTLALVQGGLAQPGDADKLVSLGAVNYEPLWLFHRADLRLSSIADFRGLRIAGGAAGSGTRQVVDMLLERNGLGAAVQPVLPLSGLAAAEALERGEADVAFLVSAPDGPAALRLMRAPGVTLMSWRRADAYVRQFPVLTRVDIPEGAIDLLRNLPPHDTVLVSLTFPSDLQASWLDAPSHPADYLEIWIDDRPHALVQV
ncbi:MAG: TAXI family TRAP transporter solute-binding subunit, partial [Burkholderiales bacterium]